MSDLDRADPGAEAPPSAAGPDRRALGMVLGLVLLAVLALAGGLWLGRRGAEDSGGGAVALGGAAGSATFEAAGSVGVPGAGGAAGSGAGVASGGGDTAGLQTGIVQEGKASLGEPVPDFNLETPDGGRISLAEFAGQPMVINFWATWCRPCAVEMPLFEAAQHMYGDQGLAIIGVNVGEPTSLVKPFLEERGLTFPVALDLNSRVADQYNIYSYPTTYFVDRDGKVINIRRGMFANQFDLDQGINLILAERDS